MSNTKKTLRSNNTIGYKGVSKTKKKFKATITVDRKINNLGIFETPKEAALAYDRAVTHHKLPAKKLNFPNGLPIDDDDYDALMNPTRKENFNRTPPLGTLELEWTMIQPRIPRTQTRKENRRPETPLGTVE